MYRVNIVDKGRHNNTATGYRYILTKRQVENFLKLVKKWHCRFEVEKFVYINNGIFCWSEVTSDFIF